MGRPAVGKVSYHSDVEKLDPRPRRVDLTDREITSLLGGLIGSLSINAPDTDTVRRAVRWWAENDDGWHMVDEQRSTILKALGAESFARRAG
jgi:hypothetical protein